MAFLRIATGHHRPPRVEQVIRRLLSCFPALSDLAERWVCKGNHFYTKWVFHTPQLREFVGSLYMKKAEDSESDDEHMEDEEA